MFGSWFGGSGSSQARKDAPKKAILGLRQQLDMLQKREKHLESQIAEQENVARKNVSSNKTGESLSGGEGMGSTLSGGMKGRKAEKDAWEKWMRWKDGGCERLSDDVG